MKRTDLPKLLLEHEETFFICINNAKEEKRRSATWIRRFRKDVYTLRKWKINSKTIACS
jgi:hypothetical protein